MLMEELMIFSIILKKELLLPIYYTNEDISSSFYTALKNTQSTSEKLWMGTRRWRTFAQAYPAKAGISQKAAI